LDIAIYPEATPGVDSDLFLKTKNLHPILVVEAILVVELEVELEEAQEAAELLHVTFHK
jgi:hypothetical protein